MHQEIKTKSEHFYEENGNALIYVLIAIVLFAALSFTLGRQTDSGEASGLSDEKAELYATQMISYAAQAKSAVDQMLFSGSQIDDLGFTDPSAAGFSTGTQLDRASRVFHPEGGGLIKGRIPPDVVDQNITDPEAGWYMGRFNNVEWTATTADDVILIAYQISQTVCEKINQKINGTTAIPVIGDAIKDVMIDASFFTGSNTDLLTDPTGSPICAECHEIGSLCVQNNAQNAYGFYTIIADQ